MQKILLFSLVLALYFPTASAQNGGSDNLLNLQDNSTHVHTGVTTVLRVNLPNNLQSYAYVIQVTDPDGFTAYISYVPVTLQAGEQKTLSISWTPEKDGAHRVQAFAWSGVIPSANAPKGSGASCTGTASCFTGTVAKIVDGDTLDVGKTRIRLALVNTPERGEPGYREATSFTASVCPVGSTALVDEDDGQTAGSYGRMVGKVTCSGKVLNEQLLETHHAQILTRYCDKSEFSSEPWAIKFGC